MPTYPLILLVNYVLLCWISSAQASELGRSGFSGNPATQNGALCTVCHVPSTALSNLEITLSGPTTVEAGGTYDYIATIIGGPGQTAGINISASDFKGELIPFDASLHRIGRELSHSQPKAFTDGTASFRWRWIASGFNGPVTFYAAVNSSNNNRDLLGDSIAASQLTVTVQNGTTEPPSEPPPSPPAIELTEFSRGLDQPVAISHAHDERLFVLERRGRIRIINPSGELLNTSFLDISEQVDSGGGEQGLLGLAFHPRYQNNGLFYVYYTATPSQQNTRTRIARFQVSSDPNRADATSEQVLLEFEQPFANHNGGDLHFGPDGYLYIASGDGGSGGDPQDNGQNNNVLLGKLLRIDVNAESGSNSGRPDCDISGQSNYRIPSDNAFNDGLGGTCDEIFATGLRNPWRFSFDRANDDLWIGDVGQNAVEEINFTPAGNANGLNFGWRCLEGNRVFNSTDCGAVDDYFAPIYDYPHTNGACSVTGGYVYRGSDFPTLLGRYIFADFCDGLIRVLDRDNGITSVSTVQPSESLATASAFGENAAGELFVANLNQGRIFQISGNGDAPYTARLRNISYNGLVAENGIKLGLIVAERTIVVISAESLAGAQAALPDPSLLLKTISGIELATNHDCELSNMTQHIGRELSAAQDACIVTTLEPGAYVIEVKDPNGASGNALISATASDLAPPTLLNISYNGPLTSSGIQPGLIVDRQSLFAITAERLDNTPTALANPFITLKTLTGTVIQTNDDCDVADIATHIGRPLATAQDACVVTMLDPNAYVVEIRDANHQNGHVLFSVIESVTQLLP